MILITKTSDQTRQRGVCVCVCVCVCVYLPRGKIQHVPPSPTTLAELLSSPFRQVFEHLPSVEINDLLDVGCFTPVDKQKVSKGCKIVASK